MFQVEVLRLARQKRVVSLDRLGARIVGFASAGFLAVALALSLFALPCLGLGAGSFSVLSPQARDGSDFRAGR